MTDERAEFELHGPAGFWGRFSGVKPEHLIGLVVVAMLGVLIWSTQKSDHDRDKRYLLLQQQILQLLQDNVDIKRKQDTILKSASDQASELRVVTYVLSRNEEERKKLNLEMPDILRERVRR